MQESQETEPASFGEDARLDRRRARAYWFCWGAVAVMMLVDAAWMLIGGYRLRTDSAVRVLEMAAGLIAVTLVLQMAARWRPRVFRGCANALAWYCLMLCFMAPMATLSYLSMTVDAPLIDATVVRWDRFLGFDWPVLYHWVGARPALQRVLQRAYQSGGEQMLLLPAILAILGLKEDLADFVILGIVSGIVLMLVSTPFPSSSAFLHYHVSNPELLASLSHFAMLRAGQMHRFDLLAIQGLVSMPSYHAAVAVQLIYVLRHTKLFFPIALVLDGVMIASTPTQGGHYLVDVIAGIAMSGVCIYGLRWAKRTDARRTRDAERSIDVA